MFDKSSECTPHASALPDLAIVRLTGADAARFAQAQFMNDVASLPAGHWQWNGWLTPKGRVIALFALMKCAEEDVRLVLLDAEPAEFCAALARFVFRSKVKVVACADVQVVGRFAAPMRARGNVIAELDDGALELDFGAEGGPRTLLLTTLVTSPASGSPLPQPLSQRERGVLDTWHHFDLIHGLPRLLPGQAGHWTPQQLSLDRLNAYSVKKGCYPGQEIVARTHFLGQAKRGLVRLRADAAITPAMQVQVDDTAPAPLVACAGQEALAVLALNAAPDVCYRIGNQPAKQELLLDGLAR